MSDVPDPGLEETSPPRRPPRRRRGRPSRARGHPNSSDAAAARWTIRGVPPPVRAMALRAADARGMTVGDWVAEAIVAMVRGSGDTSGGANLPSVDPLPDLTRMVQSLDERLSRLEAQQNRSFFGRLFGRRA